MKENRVNKMERNARPPGITSSLRIKVRDKAGRITIESKKEGQTEKRFSRKAGKAIQIVWKDSKIVHLHCKATDCGNEWKIKESPTWTKKFEVKGTTIKCIKCGRIHESG